MGFSSTDNYVSTMIGSLGSQVQNALGTAATEVAAGRATAAMTRWFGDSSPAFRKTLAKDLNQLRANLNIRTITVGYEELSARDSGTNAGAWNDFTKRLNLGTNLSQIPTGRSAIELDMGFRSLPLYMPLDGTRLIDATGYNQSKFETLIHELSHLLLGTKDEDWNGKDAYGAKRASRLAANNPAKAKNNAENWGIFIEAVGYHKTS